MNRPFAWLVMTATIVAVWQFSMSSGIVSPAVLSTPAETALAIPRILAPDQNLRDFVSTGVSSLVAFLVSIPLGLAIGLLVGLAGPNGRPWEFVLDFVRSVPATALVPVFLIVFGLSSTTKVLVGAFSSTLVIAMATIAGLSARNHTRRSVASLYRIRTLQRLLFIDVPEMLPQVFVGFRAAISLALVLVVVAEMLIGGDRGLGRVIADMRYTDDKPRLYAAIALTGGLGYFYNVALRLLEGRLIHWKGY